MSEGAPVVLVALALRLKVSAQSSLELLRTLAAHAGASVLVAEASLLLGSSELLGVVLRGHAHASSVHLELTGISGESTLAAHSA